MHHVLRKVQIPPGKCSAYIVFLLISALGQLLELRHNQVITSLSVAEGPHAVIHFFSAVEAQHDIIHLTVHKFLNLIIEKNSG